MQKEKHEAIRQERRVKIVGVKHSRHIWAFSAHSGRESRSMNQDDDNCRFKVKRIWRLPDPMARHKLLDTCTQITGVLVGRLKKARHPVYPKDAGHIF